MISESEKSKIFEIISENQKLYFAICRIIYNYKYSKSKTYDNDYDLHGGLFLKCQNLIRLWYFMKI